jgi:uncharacterized phage protein (TIGR01671 family)
MREIKFRAWDKNNKAMCKVKKILSFDGMMHLILDNPNADFWGNNYGANTGWVELMQYTGLHDSNGKEIYEGDIVCFQTFAPNTDWDDGIMIWVKSAVEWSDSLFAWVVKGQSNNSLNSIIKTGIEVIGNIYESEVSP